MESTKENIEKVDFGPLHIDADRSGLISPSEELAKGAMP